MPLQPFLSKRELAANTQPRVPSGGVLWKKQRGLNLDQ